MKSPHEKNRNLPPAVGFPRSLNFEALGAVILFGGSAAQFFQGRAATA